MPLNALFLGTFLDLQTLADWLDLGSVIGYFFYVLHIKYGYSDETTYSDISYFRSRNYAHGWRQRV